MWFMYGLLPLQGVLLARNLQELLFMGTVGIRCCCPLTSRTRGVSDNFFNFYDFFNSYNFYNLTSVTEKM